MEILLQQLCTRRVVSRCPALLFCGLNFTTFTYERGHPSCASVGSQRKHSCSRDWMITMISVYLNVFNTNLPIWFSAMIWDDHTGRLATLPMMLPPTTLLGRDLPHRERNILTNFAHSDDASSKHKGRQLRSGSQDEGSAEMHRNLNHLQSQQLAVKVEHKNNQRCNNELLQRTSIRD